MSYQVFVSYSSHDRNFANAVCARLEANDIRCWIAPRDIPPGSEWGGAILSGIEACKILLVVFSSNANLSKHVLREIERAVNRGLTIIPLRIEDVLPSASFEYFLSAVHWLDAITPPFEAHLEKIRQTVQSLLPEFHSTALEKPNFSLTQPPRTPNKYEYPTLDAVASASRYFRRVGVSNIDPVFGSSPFLLVRSGSSECALLRDLDSPNDTSFTLDDPDFPMALGDEGTITSMHITSTVLRFNSSLEARTKEIKREFGPFAEHADFSHIKRAVTCLGAPQFIDLMGLRECLAPEIAPYDGVDYWNQGPFVTYKGQVLQGSRAFFISIHDGVPMKDWHVVETIDNHSIDLGSWRNNRFALACTTRKFSCVAVEPAILLSLFD